MLILYVAMKYDYGDPSRGLSFEHCTFYDTLRHMGHDLIYFDFKTLEKVHGREIMNHQLVQIARDRKPDLLFSVLSSDEVLAPTIRDITDLGVPTVNWFCDDHWRFESFSQQWAPAFSHVITTARSAVPKYADLGIRAIKSQWACNSFSYRRLGIPLKRKVTFIGQEHGDRREWMRYLEHHGILVTRWGMGWKNGRLAQDEMIRVFNESRINLNLSNASAVPPKFWRRAMKRFGFVPEPVASPMQQIKGRDFEVPGCGGFLLTGRADNLGDYYVDRREIVCYENARDLVEKIRYYLSHEEERAAIAKAGYERTLREHTYVHRFAAIFRQMGLAHPAADLILEHPPIPGHVAEAA